MNLHNDLYAQYASAKIGSANILRAYENGYINAESTNVILSLTPNYTLEQVVKFKSEEFSYFCDKNIASGIDVTLNDGTTEHFSLTDNDQININSALTELMMGVESIEYHSDNGPFKLYSSDDMMTIYTTAQSKVKTETAYRNNLREWIKQLTDVEEIRKIAYGMDIPEEYWTDGWRSIQEKIKRQQEGEYNKVTEQVMSVSAEDHGAEESTIVEPKEGIVAKAINTITGKSTKNTSKNTKPRDSV